MHILHYPVRPWLHDHHFGGRTVLPAVECMRLMAAAHAGFEPQSRPNCVLKARFLRLVEVTAEVSELEFLLESVQDADKKLLSLWRRLQLKGMQRMLRCAELEFIEEEGRARSDLPAQPAHIEQSLAAERIYQGLVPFGPAFQSLSGVIWLAGLEAGGEVRAPKLDGAAADAETRCWPGSPFPLDGAMHLASVHGQRRADFVPFPVAMARRRVYRSTRPGESYQARVCLRRQEADSLVYDLWLMHDGDLCEEVEGLLMRDVSAGRMRPPAWWRYNC